MNTQVRIFNAYSGAYNVWSINYKEKKEQHINELCRGDWGPLGHGVHWDTPSSRKSPTYRAHEMPFSGSLGTPIVQEH